MKNITERYKNRSMAIEIKIKQQKMRIQSNANLVKYVLE